MAKVKEITIRMSRKVSDDNYGSFGVEGEIILELEDKEDKDEMWAYGTSWLSDKLAGTHKAHGTVSSQPDDEPVLHDAPKEEPQPQQSGLLDDTAKTFLVETLSVEVKGGKRYVKAKGGNFKIYGVNVWPEVLALPPLEWDAKTLDGADYPAPAGLTAIYVEKEIEKSGEAKMVPDKVTGWK